MSTDQIWKAALALSDDEKMKLAEDLMASLESDDRLQLHPEWAAEIERRIDDYEAGRTTARPAHEAIENARRRLR